MILKNFWAHRKQNGFIFAEIVIITILSFWAFDHCVMTVYDRYILKPDGEFEKKHLLVGYVLEIQKQTMSTGKVGFNAYYPRMEEGKEEATFARLRAYRDQIRKMPEVQHAGYVSSFIGTEGIRYDRIKITPEADSTRFCRTFHMNYILDECFFETHGLTTIDKSPLPEQLSRECPNEGVVITRSLALQLFDTDDVIGKRIVCHLNDTEEDVIHRTIAGVIKDVKPFKDERYCYILFFPYEYGGSNKMLIRLKPDANTEAFVEKMKNPGIWDEKGNSKLDNFLYLNLLTYKDSQKKNKTNEGNMTGVIFYSGSFGLLFMLNVILGTLGTYWLQIRKRTGDFGIMRSFGAKRKHIFQTIWCEGALLTFLACLLGQLIWLQVALHFGLARNESSILSGRETDWTMQFWPHFLIVCVAQYIFTLLIVSIGIIAPSLLAIYKKPVDALRYE